ncbi:MAG TPA: VC0807 family protein [Rhizomicrobium sp.]|nr:VC0807 family protein [Rhizomicrobium sp.]
MTDIPPTATGVAPIEPKDGGYSAVRTFFSISISIVINAVLPYLIYRWLEPRFPAGSLIPLLASTVFPLLALLVSFLRRRADIIAIISLVEITISIVVTLVASNIEYALIARALQGTLTGVFFLITILIGRPLLYYVARQFIAAGSPAVLEGFTAANARDGLRTFKRLTALWGLGTILSSVANVWLATHVSPANYLLISPIIGVGSNVVMIAVTIRYASSRLRRVMAS